MFSNKLTNIQHIIQFQLRATTVLLLKLPPPQYFLQLMASVIGRPTKKIARGDWFNKLHSNLHLFKPKLKWICLFTRWPCTIARVNKSVGSLPRSQSHHNFTWRLCVALGWNIIKLDHLPTKKGFVCLCEYYTVSCSCMLNFSFMLLFIRKLQNPTIYTSRSNPNGKVTSKYRTKTSCRRINFFRVAWGLLPGCWIEESLTCYII